MEDHDEALIRECRSHYIRYGDLFIEDHENLFMINDPQYLDPGDFGV
jgi:hypothetical protein